MGIVSIAFYFCVVVNVMDVCILTGENVIRGDNDSIKNLLEIFDGLLEYLKEEIVEESHNGGNQIYCHFPFLVFFIVVTTSDNRVKVSGSSYYISKQDL